jgi:hypothetical protein
MMGLISNRKHRDNARGLLLNIQRKTSMVCIPIDSALQGLRKKECLSPRATTQGYSETSD